MAQLLVPRATEHLTLRTFNDDDYEDLIPLYGHAEVARYLYWEPRDADETLATLERHLQRPLEIIDENVLPVAVVLNETGRVIGDIMLRRSRNEHRQGEVGGTLHPHYHGRGFAGEIYRELLRIGFGQYSLRRIIGRCDGRNIASIRSLEKAGLHREARLVQNEFVKGELTDEVILAIRREQWEQSGASPSS